MARSLRIGRAKVGLLALALGAVVHLLLPAALVFAAYGLDRLLGNSLSWGLWVRLPFGAVLLILSVALEGSTLPHFIHAGGLPSPLTPTESLVVTGPHRYCRNPIYIAYLYSLHRLCSRSGDHAGVAIILPSGVAFLALLSCSNEVLGRT